MKLKKIASLMLAGIMAVSMLAGCKSGDNNNNDDNTEVTPTVSNAVSVMNGAQDSVKFESSADYDAALAAAAKKADHTSVKNATYNISIVNSGDVFKELGKKLAVDANLTGVKSSIWFSTLGSAAAGKSVTKTGLWIVDADGLTEKAALEQVAATMKGKDTDQNKEKYPETVTLTGASAGTYEATYTGNVSIVAVNTSDKGENATAYYIAVSVTQTLARDAQTNV